MSNNTKGKLTIKDKEEASDFTPMTDWEATDSFAIDPALIKEIGDQNFAYKWINAIKHEAKRGFDSRQWMPYKRIGKPIGFAAAYGYADPEGYIRRGDLVLAVRPMAVHERKIAQTRAKSQGSAKDFQKQSAAQLRGVLADGGIKAKIHEGYEENE